MSKVQVLTMFMTLTVSACDTHDWDGAYSDIKFDPGLAVLDD